MCAECTAIQIEDASLENQRSNFQMTRLRHFSHYSRDFQVEQKFNRIKQNKPNFQLQVLVIYPEYLQDQREALILKSGIYNPNKKIDLNAETIKKSYNVGNLKMTSQIKSQTIESISEDGYEDHKLLAERANQVDAFLILIDTKTDYTQLGLIIEQINKYCKIDALIFLIAAKQTPTPSFIEAQNKEQQGVEDENPNKEQYQGSAFEINEQKLVKSQANNKSNIFASFLQQDQSEGKLQVMQTHIKNLIESNFNIDFMCIDYDSVENMNLKLENIFSQCIYSQDSRLRSTQI